MLISRSSEYIISSGVEGEAGHWAVVDPGGSSRKSMRISRSRRKSRRQLPEDITSGGSANIPDPDSRVVRAGDGQVGGGVQQHTVHLVGWYLYLYSSLTFFW